MKKKDNGLTTDTILDRNSAIPLGTQLAQIIKEKISSGEWAPDSMIPSENKLCEQYGLSRMTVRNVITNFVTQGLMFRIPGKGTFITDVRSEFSSLNYSGIRQQLEEQGHSITTVLLSCKQIPARNPIASRLNISTEEKVYEIKRTRVMKGINISYHVSYIPVAMCPDLDKKDLQNEQLCVIINTEYPIVRSRVVETLEALAANESLAKNLNVKEGAPLLLLCDTIYSKENDIYEFSQIYFRSDKIKIRLETN